MDTVLRSPARAPQRFQPLDYPLCLTEPRYLSDTNAWEEHVPFAFACVEMLRPCVLVELAPTRATPTWSSVRPSICCKLATKCYAVDTWKGDEHTGFYDEGVFQELKSVPRPALQQLFAADPIHLRRSARPFPGRHRRSAAHRWPAQLRGGQSRIRSVAPQNERTRRRAVSRHQRSRARLRRRETPDEAEPEVSGL